MDESKPFVYINLVQCRWKNIVQICLIFLRTIAIHILFKNIQNKKVWLNITFDGLKVCYVICVIQSTVAIIRIREVTD